MQGPVDSAAVHQQRLTLSLCTSSGLQAACAWTAVLPGGRQVELLPGTADDVYLHKLQQALDAAAVLMPQPQLIIYNAGTDILAGDPLGR